MDERRNQKALDRAVKKGLLSMDKKDKKTSTLFFMLLFGLSVAISFVSLMNNINSNLCELNTIVFYSAWGILSLIFFIMAVAKHSKRGE